MPPSREAQRQEKSLYVQVMQRRVKRIVEDVKAAVGAEVETIIAHGLPEESGGEWLNLMQVFPSADLLLDELEVHLCPALLPSLISPPYFKHPPPPDQSFLFIQTFRS